MSMRVIPSLDILGGSYVRLRQGDFRQATRYGDDPQAAARSFADAGASLIHLVDLEGARSGWPVQSDTILAIAGSVPVPVQVGGGLRTMDQIEGYLERGVARVILGSAAVKDPELVRAAVDRYGERIVLGLDARRGLAAVEGWTESSACEAVVLAKSMAALGVREVIYTDIERDGMLSGPNLAELAKMARESGLSVIASGGISSYEDLEALAALGLSGAILGKALHDGRIDLRTAIERLEAAG